MNIGAIILAAGGSTRLGEPKQLLQYQGKSLLHRATEVALASDCSPVIVVLGAQYEVLSAELSGLDLIIVDNPEWQGGMATSIKVGLDALWQHYFARHHSADGTLFLLCDQPLLTTEHLNTLVSTFNNYPDPESAPIVASAYSDTAGVPALFPKRLFLDLLQLPGSGGAKQIIERYTDTLVTVSFPGGELDIDTPEDVSTLNNI